MRGGWARFGAVVLSATALAAVTLFLISSSSAASQLLTGDSTGSVEKATIEKGGSCSLGTYIKAMPCSKNGESPACCAGLKSVFNNGCPCVAIPGIVISHGGTANSLIHNLMRCEPTDETGTVAPVDYVAHKLGCTDRPEWCGDRIPNVDVRVDGFSKGRIQIAATATQWTFVFATPEERDAVGSTVCHALGWGRGEIDPKADVDGSKLVTKRMTCGPEAQASHRISDCTITEIPPQLGALRVRCSGSGKGQLPTNCMRLDRRHHSTESNEKSNNLVCESSFTGVTVKGHTRSLGAPHAVCGTAGINESRIVWPDGWQDDFETYAVTRDELGVVREAQRVSESAHSHGQDLLTTTELAQRSRFAKIQNFVAAHPGIEDALEAHESPSWFQE